jgi:peptidoglycan/xylan/chitin deacetylase (PgdA/CDA1 family)
MKAFLRQAFRTVDGGLTASYLALRDERPALLAFLFHGLFESRAEAESGVVAPFQPMTVGTFRRFILHFLEAGYRFVTPAEIEAGLPLGERHALITFDDGYANNLLALPVLRELNVPATVFVSTNHVREQRAYWWDALHRGRIARGGTIEEADAEAERLKVLRFDAIEGYIREAFGADALRPVGDVDRPLREDELRALAAESLITIGNHTTDHAILPVYDDRQAAEQIRDCQAYLGEILGAPPAVIAYPNGNHDDRIVAIAEQEGLKVGLTVEEAKTVLPLRAGRHMRIPRYFLSGREDIDRECRACRSDLQLRYALRRLRA